MVSGIQIIGAAFGFLASYFTFLHFKREEFTIKEFLGWELLWVGFILVTITPERFLSITGNLGALRPLDFFVIVGFIVVLSISFYTYVYVDKLNKKLEKAIRDIALSEIKSSTSNSNHK